MQAERALSEIISVALILTLVVLMVVIFAAFFFGMINLTPKSAYIAVDMTRQTTSGKEVISLFNRGGDTGYLDATGQQLYSLNLYVDDTTMGSIRVPPPTGTNSFGPGASYFVYYNSSTGYNMTNNTARLGAADTSLPGSLTGVRLVDQKSQVLLAKWDGSSGSNQTLSVVSIAPTSGYNTTSVTISDLIGTGFSPVATVKLNRTSAPEIPATGVTVVSSTKITGSFNLNNAPAGLYNVVVSNTGGRSAVLAGGFTVKPAGPAPTVASINLTTGYRGWNSVKIITGTNFVSGATSKLNRTGTVDIPASTCTFGSSTQLICTYDLLGRNASPPNYNVVVTNPDGRSGMRTNYFILSNRAPTISGSTPSSGLQTATVSITNLAGAYFQPGATVDYYLGGTRINLTGTTVVSPTKITGTLVIPADAPLGAYAVNVTNPAGVPGTRASTFTVNTNAPAVTSIAPTSGNRGWQVNITALAGARFQSGAVVKLVNSTAGPDITATDVVINPANTSITCKFDLTLAPAARRNVTVTNPDGKVGTLANGFRVTSTVPTITSSTPNTGIQASSVSITRLSGANFQPGATVVYSRGAYTIPLTSLTVVNTTSITGTLVIPSDAPVGTYNITVTNTDGVKGIRTNAFTVTSNAPTVSGITPNTYVRGWTVTISNLAGTRFQNGATVRLVNATAGPDISATNVVVVSATKITCDFDLTLAPAARRNITVTNPDGKTGTLANGFTITSNAPTLSARNPTSGNRGWLVNIISLTGTGFQPGATVRLNRTGYTAVGATGVNVASPTSINAGTFNLLGVTAGTWNIIVTNPDGKPSTTVTFTVRSLTPTITGITPNTAARGTTVSITNLVGTSFQPGASLQLRNTSRIISNATAVNVASPTQITCEFTIPSSGVRPGTNGYYIRVTNTDNVAGNSGNIFSIT